MSNTLQYDRITNKATCDPRLSAKRMKKGQRKAVQETIRAEIEDDVMKWLVTQPPERFAQLPEDSCKSVNPQQSLSQFKGSTKTVERLELRAGDHFNVLFGLPGK